MFEKIKNYAKAHNMIKKEDCIIVGVSGGADSVCLLFVLLELQKEEGFHLVAVHVNHGLRGDEAARDEEFVKRICEENQVKCICFYEDVELLAKKWKQSTEEAGRNFRRACFEKVMQENKGTKIALAHHKNDSAETFLLNLARGTGLKGLGGISPVQGHYIRPLLCVERSDIESYVEEKGISYCTDETNAGDDYARNRVRNHVIPFMEEALNEKTVAHMDETMGYLREVQNFLEEQADEYENTCVSWGGKTVTLNKEAFLKVPNVVRPLILKRMLAKIAGKEKDLEAIHVKTLDELLEKQVGKKVDLPYGMEARRCYEGLLLCKKNEKVNDTKQETFFTPEQQKYQFGEYHITCRLIDKREIENNREKGGTEWFDYGIMDTGISFRSRQPGDYITIHDDGRTQKLKAFFINEKVPQEERDDILLITVGSHVLWACGYRRGCAYKITEHTQQVLEIKVDKGEESWQKKSQY